MPETARTRPLSPEPGTGAPARTTRALRLGLLAGLAAALCAGCGTARIAPAAASQRGVAAPELPSGWAKKTIRYANRDMVAAANPQAVDAGVKVLAAGGSAVDAAIAVQMVLNLVEPQSSGIGGGAFMLHYDAARNTLTTYDGRETAPAAASADMFRAVRGRNPDFFAVVGSGLSVGTPGLLRMLEMAHRAHGRLPWSALFADAIRMSEDGFAVSPRLAAQIAGAAPRIAAQGDPVRPYFLNPDGTPKTAGTLLKNPDLAQTLRSVAAGGADAFYSGPIARAIVDRVRGHPVNPGRLTLQDMADYRARERPALCDDYRAFKVCGMGPPSSGGIAVLQTLGILGHFDLRRYAPDSVDAVHLVSEAYRLVYADRARYVADSDFVDVPIAGLLDRQYLQGRAASIRIDRSMGVPAAGVPKGAASRSGVDDSLSLPSTSHISIVDGNGNAVSMTTSIEFGFGSLQMVGGFLLNNQLTDFAFSPVDERGDPVANRVEPGKRPRSSMSPTIVFDADNRVEAVLGSPGGPNIIQYVVKTLLGLIDWRLDIQQAIDLPNFGAQTGPATTLERHSAAVDAREELEARGHQVRVLDENSGVHGIVFNGMRGPNQPGRLARDPGAGRWAGGADPRREGIAKGND